MAKDLIGRIIQTFFRWTPPCNKDEIYLNAHKACNGDRFISMQDFDDCSPCPPYEMQIVVTRALRNGMITTAKGLTENHLPALPVNSGDYLTINISTKHALAHPLLLNARSAVIQIMYKLRAGGFNASGGDLGEPGESDGIKAPLDTLDKYDAPLIPKQR